MRWVTSMQSLPLGFVALHLVDEGMLGKFALQGLGTHAFQVFPNGADTFLFQQGSYFLFVMKPAYTVSFITSSTSWHTCEVGLRLKAVTATTR